MTIWTVYLHGEAEYASNHYEDAASRYNFLAVAYGETEVEIKEEKEG